MKILLEELAEILEVDNVNAENILKDFEEWDSLSVLSIIAMANEKYKTTLTAAEIDGAETVQNLYDLIEAKRG